MKIDKKELAKLFDEQFGDLPCGGWINPTLEGEEKGVLHFRCFYNDFDNEEDSWHYCFDLNTKTFY